MNPFGNDLKTNFMTAYSLKPAAYAATTNDGAAVDCNDLDGPLTAHAVAGVCTDGNYLPALEESETGSGSWTSITPYKGSFETISTSNDEEIVTVQFKRSKRYVRFVLPETSAGSTGVVFTGIIQGRYKDV